MPAGPGGEQSGTRGRSADTGSTPKVALRLRAPAGWLWLAGWWWRLSPKSRAGLRGCCSRVGAAPLTRPASNISGTKGCASPLSCALAASGAGRCATGGGGLGGVVASSMPLPLREGTALAPTERGLPTGQAAGAERRPAPQQAPAAAWLRQAGSAAQLPSATGRPAATSRAAAHPPDPPMAPGLGERGGRGPTCARPRKLYIEHAARRGQQPVAVVDQGGGVPAQEEGAVG